MPRFLLKLAVVTAAGVLVFPEPRCEAKELTENQESRLALFVGFQGTRADVIEPFKNEAIRALVTELGMPDVRSRSTLVREALLQYVLKHGSEIEPGLARSAKEAVYMGLY